MIVWSSKTLSTVLRPDEQSPTVLQHNRELSSEHVPPREDRTLVPWCHAAPHHLRTPLQAMEQSV
jgi:hypothetical protein